MGRLSAGLNYAGAAFIALGDDVRTEFLAEVERLTTSRAAFKFSRLTRVKWCQPKLTVRVNRSGGLPAVVAPKGARNRLRLNAACRA